MLKNSELYKRVISEENIYKAIYSLESYVFEKELLSPKDIEKYNNLTDKYNIIFIDKIIAECKEKIENVFQSNKLFDIEVFFKPKKFDTTTNKVEFRPIHSADLITQICIVSLLNLIMFDDTDDKRKLSDISKLLPSNFYGNIPSTNIDYLFEPWNKKYQEYSEKAIKAHNQYFKTKKYANEINLDLKKFFPTIDPLFIYNFIISKWPITSSNSDNQCLRIILEKLLFFNIKIPEEWLSVYYADDVLKKIKSDTLFYNIGIPQGLPQAYFFGNICMLLIAKEIKSKFKGDAFYYVDDSVIYTTTSEVGFFSNIQILNKSINEKIFETKQFTIQDPKLIKFNALVDYKVEIHDDKSGKSTISNITIEESLYEFAKPASAISFEIKATIDELEDASLRDKIDAILSAIDFKLCKIKDNKKDLDFENNLKLLRRYKKFYTNRLNILKLRDENEITKAHIDDFYTKYELKFDPSESKFFEKFEDDVFTFESRSLIRQLEVNTVAQNEIISSMKTFEQLFDKEIRSTNHYFSTVLTNCVEFQKYQSKTYDHLEIRTSKTIESFSRVRNKKRNDVILSIIKLLNNSKIELIGDSEKRIYKLFNEYQNGYFHFVYLNSPSFVRKIINALVSKAFNVSINDGSNLVKLDSRSIHYYELRILMFLRSYSFNTKLFVNHSTTVLSELEQKKSLEKIDLSLLEVLPIFKRYVKDPEKVDDLILVHKYVNGIWKNGSKFLHFYTLHNEEHSIELINNCTRITKTIDYLSIKADDYYILFLACYLHDISMVLYPNLDNFTEDNVQTDLIYSQWKSELSEITDIELAQKSKVKKLILTYYESVNNYFETEIRDNHHKRSSQFIKEQSDLSFIDKPLRRLVADVSEAHCYNAKDVYKLKSKAKHDIFDEKYLMIILRLADLLDMSKDRVSINILRQNINNMSEISKYHWISHMAIDNCNINSHFIPVDKKAIIDDRIKLTEIIQINIYMNTQLFNSSKSLNCKNLACEILTNDSSEHYMKISIERGSVCNGKNCNFSCKWITNKHKYLFDELIELKQYLDRNVNNIFKTEFEVVLKFENTSVIPPDYLDVIKERIE
jgi:hypothetical protein